MIDKQLEKSRRKAAMKALWATKKDADPSVTYARLGEAVGVSPQAVGNWMQGHKISEELRPAVANYLGVSMRDLPYEYGAQGEQAEQPLARSDRALLQAYRRLPRETRFHIRSLIETLDTALSPSYQQYKDKVSKASSSRKIKRKPTKSQ